MKKWIYIIFPVGMLGIFLIIYFAHVGEVHEKEAAKKIQIAREQAEANEKKRIAEEKARDDAKKRQDERDAEEAAKRKEKEEKQAADDKKVRDAIAEYTAKANAAAKQAAALEAELDRLRKEKDKTSRETFDMAKQVELARIARRNAELEIQRMTEMVVRKAHDSSLVRPPAIAQPSPRS